MCVLTHEVCEAIVTVLQGRYIRVLQGNDIEKVVNGLLSRWQLFPQCAGAVDGTHIPIIAPAENHTNYF